MKKLGEKQPSIKEVTVDDLIQRYGRPVQDTVLADFLNRDVRTIRKYAQSMGGKEIIPGVFLFTTDKLDEVILGLNNSTPVVGYAASEPKTEKSLQNQSGTPPSVIGRLRGKGGNGILGVDKHGIWTGTANNKPLTKPKKVEEPVEGDARRCVEGIG